MSSCDCEKKPGIDLDSGFFNAIRSIPLGGFFVEDFLTELLGLCDACFKLDLIGQDRLQVVEQHIVEFAGAGVGREAPNLWSFRVGFAMVP